MNPATLSRSRARAETTASPSVARSASSRFWLAQDRQHAVGLAQRRVRAVDDLGQVVAASREPAPSSLRISRKRSGYGSRMMLLTRSRSTALPLRSSGSRYWPAPGSPSGICSNSAGAGVLGARARSACIRRTSRRSATAGGSGRRRRRGSPGRRGRRSAGSRPPSPARVDLPRSPARRRWRCRRRRPSRPWPRRRARPRPRPGSRRCRRSPAPRSCRRRRRRRRRRRGSRTTAISAVTMARILFTVRGARRSGDTRRRARRRRGTGGRSGSANLRSAASTAPGQRNCGPKPSAEKASNCSLSGIGWRAPVASS